MNIPYIPCEHIDRISDAVKNYNIVLAYYVTCIAENSSKRKAADARCRLCRSRRRIHACLECAFFGCVDVELGDGNISHMEDHASKNNHFLAINLNHGTLFCFICEDYIYDEIYENIFLQYKLEASKIEDNRYIVPNLPTSKEIAVLKTKIKKISESCLLGLRGIPNIGHSCYVNCVIQVLVHTPVMRDFFFCDKHECFKSDSCLMCEMFVLFQEFYCGITVPFNPLKRFFGALQKYCLYPLGRDPQDAYLFFLEILEGLHDSCQEDNQSKICDCAIHEIFFGLNRSIKLCSHCKTSSDVPLDFFVDILLDLEAKSDSLIKILDKKLLQPELLPDYCCSNCKQKQTTSLFQTIEKLPIVMCFRINWLKGDSPRESSRSVKGESSRESRSVLEKKSTAFAFEECIDMSPYLHSELDPDKFPSEKNTSNSILIENRYCLYAVIFHKGHALGGHWAAYVKQRRKWYECDDMYIYRRSLEEVRECEPVLLFYYKQI